MIALEQTLAAALAAQPTMEPILPFDAMVAGSDVMVTAVMERTAAYYTLGDRYDSHVIRLDLVLVDPVDIKWRTATATRDGQRVGRRWNGARGPEPTTAEERQLVRDRTDQEALADQQRKAKQARRITPMPTGKPSPTTLAKPKTCRVCGKEKPRDQFPTTGMNARRCYDCAALVKANEEKPLPIKRSVLAKAARVIPAERVQMPDLMAARFGRVTVTTRAAAELIPRYQSLLDELGKLFAEQREVNARITNTIRDLGELAVA